MWRSVLHSSKLQDYFTALTCFENSEIAAAASCQQDFILFLYSKLQASCNLSVAKSNLKLVCVAFDYFSVTTYAFVTPAHSQLCLLQCWEVRV